MWVWGDAGGATLFPDKPHPALGLRECPRGPLGGPSSWSPSPVLGTKVGEMKPPAPRCLWPHACGPLLSGAVVAWNPGSRAGGWGHRLLRRAHPETGLRPGGGYSLAKRVLPPGGVPGGWVARAPHPRVLLKAMALFPCGCHLVCGRFSGPGAGARPARNNRGDELCERGGAFGWLVVLLFSPPRMGRHRPWYSKCL